MGAAWEVGGPASRGTVMQRENSNWKVQMGERGREREREKERESGQKEKEYRVLTKDWPGTCLSLRCRSAD
jgi:hypothetical protein